MKEQILNYLGAGHPWAGSLQYYNTIDSTNTEAKRLADLGAIPGTVLIADHQSKGRGRTGNSFHSPENSGIYFSCILRPDCHVSELSHLTCAVAVAVCNAIEASTGFRPSVKWINDLIAGNRKLGGILTELSLTGSTQVRYAVIGIGINCNQLPEDFPSELQNIATSLRQIIGTAADRGKICAYLIKELEILSRTLFSDKEKYMQQYHKDCITLGQEIVILRGDETQYGRAIRLDSDGGLVVEYTNGKTDTVQSGEVHVRGLNGYC